MKTTTIVLIALLFASLIGWSVVILRRKRNRDAGFMLVKSFAQHQQACKKFGVRLSIVRHLTKYENEADYRFRFAGEKFSRVFSPAKALDFVNQARKGDGTFIEKLKKRK